MKCPNDDTVLQMTDRQGVEIDYCPTCRGIWLDRGELDKILERSRADGDRDDDDDRRDRRRVDQGQPDDWQVDRSNNPRGYEQPRQGGYREQPVSSGQYPQPKKKKRGSFLEDLLDFG